jgi:hypothetical protein
MYCHLSEKRGFIALHQMSAIEEDWASYATEITPSALSGLGLHIDSNPKEVQEALENLGVKFPQGMKAELFSSGKRLAVTTLVAELPKIDGILLLLSNGYKISK